MTRPAGRVRIVLAYHGSGRVGTGQVGSGRVGSVLTRPSRVLTRPSRVLTRPLRVLTRSSRVLTRPSRVLTRQDYFFMSWVRSGRIGSDRVGSGRIWSGQKVFKLSRVGSSLPDPIRPELTREGSHPARDQAPVMTAIKYHRQCSDKVSTIVILIK